MLGLGIVACNLLRTKPILAKVRENGSPPKYLFARNSSCWVSTANSNSICTVDGCEEASMEPNFIKAVEVCADI